MKRTFRAALIAAGLVLSTSASAGHYYGNPGDNDPPVDFINGYLPMNGSVSGVLPGGPGQPNENHDFVVFNANMGDVITVFLNGNQDAGLSILGDTAQNGIFVGDALVTNLTWLNLLDDDSGGNLDSLITFTAGYTGQYLAGIAEISGNQMNWTLTVSGSTASVPAPASLALLGAGLFAFGWRRRRA